MAQYLTIARPYAAALFSDAKADPKLLEAWSKVLQVLSYIMSQKPMICLTFDPKVSPQKLKDILLELVIEVVNNEVDLLGAKLDNFIRLLIEHKRLITIPDMLTLYNQLMAKAQNITAAKVISAFEIDSAEKENMKLVLAKKFQSDVSIQFEIDKDLIGGAVIRTNKFVIDGSVKSKLANLYQSLISVKG